MPFNFQLATVLKFRQGMEQREYIALERIQHEIVSTAAQLEQLETARQLAVRGTDSNLRKGTPAILLQTDLDQEQALEQEKKKLRIRLGELDNQKTQRLKQYEIARQKREVLEELRNRQFESFTREQAKREQAQIDDMFLASRHRDE